MKILKYLIIIFNSKVILIGPVQQKSTFRVWRTTLGLT